MAPAGLTPKQVQYLLTLDEKSVSVSSLKSWRKMSHFFELEQMAKTAKTKTHEGMVEKAYEIIMNALNGTLDGDEDKPQIRVAMKIIGMFPEPPKTRVVYKKWKSMPMSEIPEEKRRRILEELLDDKSRKGDAIPVEYVGHTKLGAKMGGDDATDESMFERELERGRAHTFTEEGDES